MTAQHVAYFLAGGLLVGTLLLVLWVWWLDRKDDDYAR